MSTGEEAGRLLREAREKRGWSAPDLSVELGRIGHDRHTLAPNQIDRAERGQRNIRPEEAWRLIEVLPDLDPVKFLRAVRMLDDDSSPALCQAVLEEAQWRRRRWVEGFRRFLSLASADSALTDAVASSRKHRLVFGRAA